MIMATVINPKTGEPIGCEACGAVIHGSQCIAAYTKDGSCTCKSVSLKPLMFHGRKMLLCEDCHAKEEKLLNSTEINLHEYRKNMPDRIERLVEAQTKPLLTLEAWQQIYTTERPQWVLKNFENLDDMKQKLTDFIVSMEKLEFEAKAKKRAAFDAAKELDARLSKEERDALINDPAFKVPENKQFVKIQKERELDEAIKTLGLAGATKEQRKSVEGLLKQGFDIEAIKGILK